MPVPGVNVVSAEAGLLPATIKKIVLVPVVDDDLTEEEHHAIASTVDQTSEFPISEMQLDDPLDDGFAVDTVLLRYDATTQMILRPAVAFSSVKESIPTRDTGSYQLIREQRTHRNYRVGTIRRRLPDSQRRAFDEALNTQESLTLPPKLATGLLGVWKLEP